jgi:hypothetical protein
MTGWGYKKAVIDSWLGYKKNVNKIISWEYRKAIRGKARKCSLD